jgi:hypothetical protein
MEFFLLYTGALLAVFGLGFCTVHRMNPASFRFRASPLRLFSLDQRSGQRNTPRRSRPRMNKAGMLGRRIAGPEHAGAGRAPLLAGSYTGQLGDRTPATPVRTCKTAIRMSGRL